MPSTNFTLNNMGGRVNLDIGVLFSNSDVDDMGDFAVRTLIQFLHVALYDEAIGAPQTGVAGDTRGANAQGEFGHMEARKGAGDLDYIVTPGWGMVFNSAATADDFEIDEYRPVVIETQATGSVGAHEGGERLDLIIAQPAYVEDVPTTRNVRSPVDQSTSTPTVNIRRRFSGTVSVVAGIAGSGSLPSVPAGSILLAVATVPATSGPIVITDRRKILRWSSLRSRLPGYMETDHIIEDGGYAAPLSVTTPSALGYQIQPGEAVVSGNEIRQFSTASATVTAPSAGERRHDIITITNAGTLAAVTGTAATSGTQVDPAVPSTSIQLARLVVDGDTSSIITTDDLRPLLPFSGANLQNGTVGTTAIADGAVTTPKISIAAENRTISLPGTAFNVEQNTGTLVEFDLNQGRLSPDTASALYDLEAPIQLPNGSTINACVLSVANTTGGSVSVTISIQRTSLTADAFDTVGTQTSSVATGGVTAVSVVSFSNATVDNGAYAYVLKVGFTAPASGLANLRILGVRVQVSTSQLLS